MDARTHLISFQINGKVYNSYWFFEVGVTEYGIEDFRFHASVEAKCKPSDVKILNIIKLDL